MGQYPTVLYDAEGNPALLKVPHGQLDTCGCREAVMVIWPQQKSRHSNFLRFAEQRRAVVKEVSLVDGRSCINSHVNTEPPPHCWNICGMEVNLHSAPPEALIVSDHQYGASTTF